LGGEHFLLGRLPSSLIRAFRPAGLASTSLTFQLPLCPGVRLMSSAPRFEIGKESEQRNNDAEMQYGPWSYRNGA